ncbi:nucleotide exchange factor GrpE [Spirillospora sp. NPDC029432]|uniref:nucleotide exchange factor GrpE n=1 Tax=Spirillospora sp. NPDC029432 TaxID=3154599 RepID=UPI003455F130
MSSARDSRVNEGPAPAEAPPSAAADPEADGPEAEDESASGSAPEAAPEPAEAHDEIMQALAALTKRLEREHERAAHRESVIDRLHEENQTLRRGELQSAFEPVRAALYRLHDMARREAARWASPEPPGPEHAAALLGAVADEVADALARTGVERFTVAPGEPYDSTRHRPVAVEPVTDPEAAGTVVSVRTHGFERDGRVVRKAEVGVGKAPERDTRPEPPTTDRSRGLHEGGRGETIRDEKQKPGP